MRTTVTFADDVAAAIDQQRRARGAGVSEVVNDLIRAGLARPVPPRTFAQESFSMGALIDVSNVGEVLDLLDDTDRR